MLLPLDFSDENLDLYADNANFWPSGSEMEPNQYDSYFL